MSFGDVTHACEFPCFSRLRKNKRKKIRFINGDEIDVDLSKRWVMQLYHGVCAAAVTAVLAVSDTSATLPLMRSNIRNDTPLLWVRIDPEFDWVGDIRLQQPEYMWVYQLEMDRDVIAQYVAIEHLQTCKSRSSAAALFDVVNNTHMTNYWRIRACAARALARVCARANSVK